DGPAAQASFEEVDVLPRQAREGRAQKGVEVAAATAEPRKPEQAQQRLAVRRPVEPCIGLERIRNTERAERRFERRLPPLERRADDADLLCGYAGSQQ